VEQERAVSDFVVVGAGSAGSVMVRRLLDAGHSVHLIESGPVNASPAIHSPQGWPALLGRSLDWGGFTTPQRHANDRRLFWPRARVLGGSTSLNGMIYFGGHASDYDGWAQACDDSGWAWHNVLALFKRSEDHELGGTEDHGGGGPLPVSTIGAPHPLTVGDVEAAMANGHTLFEDFNADEMVGLGYNHSTSRSWSADQCLDEFRCARSQSPKFDGQQARPVAVRCRRIPSVLFR
jgi:choline dehydrogenase